MTALLDSGSQSNYISSQAVRRARLQPQQKKDPYLLRVANKEPIPQESEITRKVSSIPIKLSKHHKEIDLDVFRIATHDIILGLPWLQKHNPKIDWVKRTLSLDCDYGTPQSRPAQLTMQLADKKEIAIISSTKTRQDRAVDRTDTDDSSGYEVTVKEKRAPPAIPDIYQQYARMFKEELMEKALPEHKP